MSLPLFTRWRGTRPVLAFFWNAVAIAIVAALTIEVRFYLDDYSKSKEWPKALKLGITVATAFLASFSVFILLRVVFGFGGGMLAAVKMHKTLF